MSGKVLAVKRLHRGQYGLFAILLVVITGCGSLSSPLPRMAAGHQVTSKVVQGTDFRHWVYGREPASASQGPLLVFLEGDGRPWVAAGRLPAKDPTGMDPLAFRLFLKTPRAARYVTRPCYEQLQDVACNSTLWTSARYSPAVVDSIAAALRSGLDDEATEVVLVGYSGGGVLAVLLAERLANVRGVISIASNLDVAAWAALHAYEPLKGSLDPARMPGASDIRQVVLVGERDRNVPPSAITGFLSVHPDAVVLRFTDFDHVCCWLRDWDAILSRALALL